MNTLKIKAHTTIYGTYGKIIQGEESVLDENTALNLIKTGLASLVTESVKVDSEAEQRTTKEDKVFKKKK
jgi:hypothetical protein